MLTNEQMVDAIKAWCRDNGINQAELASLAGVSQPFISDVMNHRRPVSAKIARVVGYQRKPMSLFEPFHEKAGAECQP